MTFHQNRQDGCAGGPSRRADQATLVAGSRNKATLAAAALLAGESEALTRKAVEMALAGDPTAMRLCMERVLPPCRERIVKFRLPPIDSALTGETCGPSAHDVSQAMNSVTSALACGEITPGEAETFAGWSTPSCGRSKQPRRKALVSICCRF